MRSDVQARADAGIRVLGERELDFQRLFEAAPAPMMALDPELTIIAVTDQVRKPVPSRCACRSCRSPSRRTLAAEQGLERPWIREVAVDGVGAACAQVLGGDAAGLHADALGADLLRGVDVAHGVADHHDAARLERYT